MRSALEMVMKMMRVNKPMEDTFSFMRMVAESHLKTPSEATGQALFSNEEITEVLGAVGLPAAPAPAAAPAQE